MLLGSSTANKLQFVTSTTGDIEVSAAAIVVSSANPPVVQGGSFLADPLPSITTATTTDIVTGAASSTTRVLGVYARNNAATSNDITVRHVDGTDTVDLLRVTLLAGEHLHYDGSRWRHLDVQGGEYSYSGPPAANLGQTGVIAESIPRELCPEVNTTVGATGVLFMQAIYLRAGQLLSNIILWSATTAAGTPTNYNAGLYDANRNLLVGSTNKTTEAWAANSQKTFPLTSSYRVPTSGLYYIGYYMTATTVATLKGGTAKTGGQLAGAAPILHGTSTGSLTTSLPNPAGAITSGTASIYAAVT